MFIGLAHEVFNKATKVLLDEGTELLGVRKLYHIFLGGERG